MGHACEQHHVQPEPAPSMPDNITARVPQPCPECSSALSRVPSASQSHGYPGGRAGQPPGQLGLPPERAECQGSTAGVANPIPAPLSVPAENTSSLGAVCGLKRWLLCESGSAGDN